MTIATVAMVIFATKPVLHHKLTENNGHHGGVVDNLVRYQGLLGNDYSGDRGSGQWYYVNMSNIKPGGPIQRGEPKFSEVAWKLEAPVATEAFKESVSFNEALSKDRKVQARRTPEELAAAREHLDKFFNVEANLPTRELTERELATRPFESVQSTAKRGVLAPVVDLWNRLRSSFSNTKASQIGEGGEVASNRINNQRQVSPDYQYRPEVGNNHSRPDLWSGENVEERFKAIVRTLYKKETLGPKGEGYHFGDGMPDEEKVKYQALIDEVVAEEAETGELVHPES